MDRNQKNKIKIVVLVILTIIIVFVALLVTWEREGLPNVGWRYDDDTTAEWYEDNVGDLPKLGYEYRVYIKRNINYPKDVRLYGRPVYPDVDWKLLQEGQLSINDTTEWFEKCSN